MTASDSKTFRRRLMEMARRLGDESAQLRHEVLGDERDPAVSTTREQYTTDDLSREKADEEVSLLLLGNEEQMLAECLAALNRIEQGTFGRCGRCGRPIPMARLQAVPYARDCIQCARELETSVRPATTDPQHPKENIMAARITKAASRMRKPTPQELSVLPESTANARMAPPPTPDEIRVLAHRKWTAAGCPPGDGVNSWLDAEQELQRANGASCKPLIEA